MPARRARSRSASVNCGVEATTPRVTAAQAHCGAKLLVLPNREARCEDAVACRAAAEPGAVHAPPIVRTVSARNVPWSSSKARDSIAAGRPHSPKSPSRLPETRPHRGLSSRLDDRVDCLVHYKSS